MPMPELALALVGLREPASVRAKIELARTLGFRAIALDATDRESRPRELGRSARRDLASLIRRAELRCVGIDAFIPPAHFVDAAHADRAAEAVMHACDFAADLASLTDGEAIVSTLLPPGFAGRRTLAAHAAGFGVRLADHHAPPDEHAGETSNEPDVGLDPATVMLAGGDVEETLASNADRIASARLSDLDSSGRTEPGTGRLDLLAYAVSLGTSGYDGPVVLDLRQLEDQPGVVRRVLQRLSEIAPK